MSRHARRPARPLLPVLLTAVIAAAGGILGGIAVRPSTPAPPPVVVQAAPPANSNTNTITLGQPAPPAPPSRRPTRPRTAPPPAPPAPSGPRGPAVSSSSPAEGPVTTLVRYFAHLNRREYAAAWAMGGSNVHHGDFASFVAGYRDTRRNDFVVERVDPDGTVHGLLHARQFDGTTDDYRGWYRFAAGRLVDAEMRAA